MTISPEHVGRRYRASSTYPITHESVKAFNDSLGFMPRGDGESIEIAPTYPIVIASQCWQMLFADEELGLHLDGTIHADQSFDFYRPLSIGDEVNAGCVIDKVRIRGRQAMVRVDVELSVGGCIAALVSSQLIFTLENPCNSIGRTENER